MRSEIVGLAFVLLTASGTSIATTFPPSENSLQPVLGSGYSTTRERVMGLCATGSTKSTGTSIADLSFSAVASESDVSDQLGLSASGRAQYGVVTASASASFAKSSRTRGHSISSTYIGYYKFKDERLVAPITPLKEASDRLKDAAIYEKYCGDEIVVQWTKGAKIFFSIQINFVSSEEKNAFEASFSISGPLASASGSLQKATQQFSRNTQVSVRALQIGGDIKRLGQIFKFSDAKESSYPVIDCSFGDFEKCNKALTAALAYAVDPDNGFSSGITDENAALLSYTTQRADETILPTKLNPFVDLIVNQRRKKLGELITNKIDEELILDSIRRTSRGLSAQQLIRLNNIIDEIRNDEKKIAETAVVCFENEGECINQTDALFKNLHEYQKADFEFPPETLERWCLLGTSPSSTKGLKRTIDALVAEAQTRSNSSFDGFDICGGLLRATTDVSALQLRDQKISDLRPLSLLKNIVELDLRKNEITDILPLSGLGKIKWLGLSENYISDIRPLKQISELERLLLSSNKISDVSDVVPNLKKLKLLEVSYNDPSLKCPTTLKGICSIKNAATAGSFFPLWRGNILFLSAVASFADEAVFMNSQVNCDGQKFYVYKLGSGFVKELLVKEPRRQPFEIISPAPNIFLVVGGEKCNGQPAKTEMYIPSVNASTVLNTVVGNNTGFTATSLKNGSILVVGSRSDSPRALIIDQLGTRIREIAGSGIIRKHHSATLLSDGKVLIAGGMTSGGLISQFEIFDPDTEEFKLGGHLMKVRYLHTATLLPDGTVLIAGGWSDKNDASEGKSVEVIDVISGTSRILKDELSVSRFSHSATLLGPDQVLFIGGMVDGDGHAEIYDPRSETFTTVKSKPNFKWLDSEVARLGKNVVVIGGGTVGGNNAGAEIYQFEVDNSLRLNAVKP